MRTRLILDDGILLEAKRRAAERGSTVSAVVNEALIAAFSRTTSLTPNPSFQMLCYRPASGKPIRTSPTEMHQLLVVEEFAPI